jgi:transcription initiation factor IIE alpha subunit
MDTCNNNRHVPIAYDRSGVVEINCPLCRALDGVEGREELDEAVKELQAEIETLNKTLATYGPKLDELRKRI